MACRFGSIAVGDFNSDGNHDLILGTALCGGASWMLVGNGDATFQPPVTVGVYRGSFLCHRPVERRRPFPILRSEVVT